jgi:hypothetical protein
MSIPASLTVVLLWHAIHAARLDWKDYYAKFIGRSGPAARRTDYSTSSNDLSNLSYHMINKPKRTLVDLADRSRLSVAIGISVCEK